MKDSLANSVYIKSLGNNDWYDMKLFNNSGSYNVNEAKTSANVDICVNLRFTHKVKSVKNTPHTMVKSIFNRLVSGRDEKKRPGLKELINKSYVVSGSGHSAISQFVNTKKFNGVKTHISAAEKKRAIERQCSCDDWRHPAINRQRHPVRENANR
ncbi:hypothetical protein ABK905_12590 [Acerihabitans sp. KWT182]|uniref:Uncharacterized protein n=1 Tax=Acerihabitans sp. KWT182 TaxID=3157919 RepID=A0AAU7QEY3_9GAMM